MSTLGFINQMLDNTNHIYSIAFKQLDWWKKTMGTEVIVTRVKQSSSYKRVFGSIANSTLPDDEDAEKFPYIVVINLNDMKKIYQKSTDQIQFLDNQDKLQIGDMLTFSRRDQEYKYKIIDVQSFSEAEAIVFQYTISGLTETLSTK